MASTASHVNLISNNKQGCFLFNRRGIMAIIPLVFARLHRARLMWFGVDHIYHPHGSGSLWSGRDNDKINERVILSGSSLRYFAHRQRTVSRWFMLTLVSGNKSDLVSQKKKKKKTYLGVSQPAPRCTGGPLSKQARPWVVFLYWTIN